jgi:hypothetical protein
LVRFYVKVNEIFRYSILGRFKHHRHELNIHTRVRLFVDLPIGGPGYIRASTNYKRDSVRIGERRLRNVNFPLPHDTGGVLWRLLF